MGKEQGPIRRIPNAADYAYGLKDIAWTAVQHKLEKVPVHGDFIKGAAKTLKLRIPSAVRSVLEQPGFAVHVNPHDYLEIGAENIKEHVVGWIREIVINQMTNIK